MCNKEKFWPALAQAIERPELADDPRFRRFADRLAHRADLTEVLDAALGQRTTAEWLQRFAGTVPAAPVNGLAAALDSEFARERGRIASVPHPARRDFRMVASPFELAGETLPLKPAPALGADTEAILGECGFSAERIVALRRDGDDLSRAYSARFTMRERCRRTGKSCRWKRPEIQPQMPSRA